MLYGTLKGIDRPISRLVLGTMVCSTDNLELTFALLDAWVAAGGNCLDTAHIYGGGKTERALGEWFAQGNRDKIILLGKGAHPYGGRKRVTPEDISQDITESLERMQTDFMDIYLLHRDDEEVPVGPIVEGLNKENAAGRIGLFGGSNWTTARIQEANDYAAEHGLQGFSASSPQLSLAKQTEPMWGGCLSLDVEGDAWHTRQQFPLFPWSSQASGFFTERVTPEYTENADLVRVYYTEENWERKHRAEELGKSKGYDANQIALAWVLSQPFPVFPLIGPRTLAELESSLPALDISLTDEERRWLNLEA